MAYARRSSAAGKSEVVKRARQLAIAAKHDILGKTTSARYGTSAYWRKKIAAKQAELKKAKVTGGAIEFVGDTTYKVIPAKEAAEAKVAKEAAAAREIAKAKEEAERDIRARERESEEKRAREEVAKCSRGTEYNIHFYQSCIAGYVKRFKPTTKGWYCLCETAVGTAADTGVITPPDTGVVECPRGLMYDEPLIGKCEAGYTSFDPGLGQSPICICTARHAEAMGLLKPIVPKEDGIGIGIGGLEGIVNILPVAIGAGVLISILSMFKK